MQVGPGQVRTAWEGKDSPTCTVGRTWADVQTGLTKAASPICN